MLRVKLSERKSKDIIRWRSHEILRIEAFSDAVFAFSITLLIVSLEVPETFAQLVNIMKGFFAFAICFAFLFQIWYFQFKYFRRYGLQNFYTTILNAVLLFVVLFYMYPLKFLFSLLIPGGHSSPKEGEIILTVNQLPELMIIYGAGFVAVHLIFVLLYINALGNKEELDLNEEEIFETRTKLYSFIILCMVGLSSITYAYFSEQAKAGYSGYFYLLIAPALSIYYSIRGKHYTRQFEKK